MNPPAIAWKALGEDHYPGLLPAHSEDFDLLSSRELARSVAVGGRLVRFERERLWTVHPPQEGAGGPGPLADHSGALLTDEGKAEAFRRERQAEKAIALGAGLWRRPATRWTHEHRHSGAPAGAPPRGAGRWRHASRLGSLRYGRAAPFGPFGCEIREVRPSESLARSAARKERAADGNPGEVATSRIGPVLSPAPKTTRHFP